MTDMDDDGGEDLKLDQLIQSAPIGVLLVDEDLAIQMANDHARELLGCQPGESLAGYIHKDDGETFHAVLANAGETMAIQLAVSAGSKTVDMQAATADNKMQRAIFINDISEKIALGRQLKSSRQPSRRLLYQLHAAATAMGGYAELIELMLDEEPLVTGERLNVIRRYHRELKHNLETMSRLLKIEREGGRRPDAAAIPIKRKQVVVVDDEPVIAEYVSELMKGLKYRVTSFTTPDDAALFIEENTDNIDLVIADHGMPRLGGRDFIDVLLDFPGEFPVVMCADDPTIFAETARTYFCHKPLDISELTRIVSDLISD